VNGAVVSAAAIGPVDWNFGDSATTFTSTGNVSPSHQYLTPNTFTVTAKGAVVGVTGQLTASTTTIVQ
jgi:hypothetical protein